MTDPALLQIVSASQSEAQLMSPHAPYTEFTFFAIKALDKFWIEAVSCMP